jgi:hypothetical protein
LQAKPLPQAEYNLRQREAGSLWHLGNCGHVTAGEGYRDLDRPPTMGTPHLLTKVNDKSENISNLHPAKFRINLVGSQPNITT